MHRPMAYSAALECLYAFADFERTGRFSARTDLAPMLDLLRELGDPQLGRVTLHVAGSKGKGSVAAMIDSILRAGGLRSGLFTSPHLQRFTERIQVQGTPVSTAEFAAGVSEVADAARRVQSRWPSRQLVTFDLLTALGFLLFEKHALAAQVIEVGLGGLLDSTNVFAAKDCNVITRIGLEHREILGDTLGAITLQKAGIIVPGGLVVMAPQLAEPADVIRQVAAERGAPLLEVGRVTRLENLVVGAQVQRFDLRTAEAQYSIELPLLGKHQLDNAATAIVAVEALARSGVQLAAGAVPRGLASVSWPARVEVIRRQPLVVVDAAHTADSARSLADTLLDYLNVSRATLVVGVMGDKDLAGLAAAIAPRASRVIATRAEHPRSLPAEAVLRAFSALSVPTTLGANVPDAVDAALAGSAASEAVVILGSVALAGEARAHLLQLERDPIVSH
jgi:dihydrofolate synthase / folylpolyglutamate synthase